MLELCRAAGHPDAKLPHRLDRMTSGVLVVATDREALAHHNRAIAERSWGPKLYIARVVAPPPGGGGGDEEDGGGGGGGGGGLALGPRKAYLKRRGWRSEVVRCGGKPSFLDVLAAEPAPGLEVRLGPQRGA